MNLIEQCEPLYFDSGLLMRPSRKLYRLSGYSGGRYYYSFDQNGEPIFFISVTNFISLTLPTPEALKKWIADKGYEESKAYAQERADYGTFMHMLFTRLLIEGKLDMDSIDDELLGFVRQQNLPIGILEDWIDDIKKDVLAFAQFLKDYKIKPLAIELVLGSIEGRYAGALDLIAKMTIRENGFWGELYKSGENKGKPKETKKEIEITAIVDYKSGRKNFYESHEIQLEAYKKLATENFPDLKIDRVYNFSPAEWRTSPGYKLKDQTDSPNLEKFDHLVGLAKIEMKKRERKVMRISGVLDMEKDLTDVYREVDITELIKETK